MVEQYVAWFKDPRTGGSFRVYVTAESFPMAQSLFEAQYGSGNVWGVGKA